MTRHDDQKLDDELDDFMAGRDALSRHLSALKQPESPAQLDTAIMASIEGKLAQEQTMRQRPAANMARWRMPLALAASVVGTLLLTLEWQRGEYAEPEQITTSAPPAPVRAASPEITVTAPPKPAAIVSDKRVHAAPAPGAPAAEEAWTPLPAPAAAPAPVMTAQPAAPVTDAVTVHRFAASSFGAAAAPAPIVARPSAAPIAPPAPDAQAAAWLHAIDEMLKADLRSDALAEWKKFRLAYPDYPVPEALARQIAAIE